MDKRNFIAFLALSLAALMLSNILFPPPPPPAQEKPAPADAKVEAGAKAEADRVADAPLAAAPDSAAAAAPADGDRPAANAQAADVSLEPLEFVTLGSLDRETGFRLLVTLTNQGAAVHRTELSSHHFRDLNDRSGYLGNLELETTPEGIRVRVVGAGTPAEQAGVRVGDLIVGVGRGDDQPVDVKSVDDFEAVRKKTVPGNALTLKIVRGTASENLTTKLTRRPMDVTRPEVENVRMRGGVVPPGFVDPPSFLVGLASVGEREYPADAQAQLEAWLADERSPDDPKAKELSAAVALQKWLGEGHWKVGRHDASSVEFERPVPAYGLKFIKRYTLEPVPPGSRSDENYPGYNIRLDVEIENTGEVEQSVAYRLEGPTGLPLEGWWYTHKISQRWFSAAGLRDVVVRFQGRAEQQIDCATIAEDKAEPMGRESPLAFVGVDAVYFSAVLIPVKQSLEQDWFDSTEAIRVGPRPDGRTPVRFTNVSCRMTRLPVALAPGQSQLDSYVVFLGPKRPELLAQYKAANDPNYSLKDIIYYGMWPFGAVARGMLGVLHFFYGIVGNYGLAIIMLTVVVRGAMFPVSFKQTQNMARMQALKPELDRITEKYKTDMQKRSAAMQEVYRKNKINPLGGCLPVFLQLPVFIGLYRSIMIDVELRQAPLFGFFTRWCSDLSAPDMLYDWSWMMPQFVNNGEGIFGLGPYFNILPIVTVVLFLVSMKMSMPEPTNEQAVMQQKMMKYMTGFMGLLFYKVASGLCLYFIASSLWGLGERRLLKKTNPGANSGGEGQAVAKKSTPPAPSGGSNGVNGSPGKSKGEKAKRKR